MIPDNRTSRCTSMTGLRFRLGVALTIFLCACGSWGQKEVQTNFYPASELGQVKLDARSAPATVTTKDETALASEGYVDIGLVEAHRDGKKTGPEVTQALDAAALARAAEAGCDLVRFDEEGAPIEKDVSKDKRKCIRQEQQTQPCGIQPGTSHYDCTHYVEVLVCVEWETIPSAAKMKQVGTESRGSAWRYDPNLISELKERRAASEKATAKAREQLRQRETVWDSLCNLIGKDIGDADVTAWLSETHAVKKDNALERYKLEGYESEESGISFDFHSDGKTEQLIDIIVEPKKFPGALPFGLSRDYSNKELVSHLLGRPNEEHDSSTGTWSSWTYKSHGLQLDFEGDWLHFLMITRAPSERAESEGRAPEERAELPYLPDAEALRKAAYAGDTERVKLILAKGIDVNARTGDSLETALIEATDHLEVVSLLLSSGADVKASNKHGMTALHYAVRLKEQIDVAKLLLAEGAAVNARNDAGETPLHIAARLGNKEGAELLVGKGADVNARNSKGQTPLGEAVESKKTEVAELLRRYGGHE